MVAVLNKTARLLKKGLSVGRNKTAKDLSTLSGRIGNAVCILRTFKGTSVEKFRAALARHGCEVSEATIYAWEAGTRPIPINDLPAIAKALRTTVRDLIAS